MGSFVEQLDSRWRHQTGRPAIVDGNLTLTYGQLVGWSERIASELEKAGRVTRRPVALMTANSSGFVASFLGAARAGAVVAPLNPAYRLQELSYYLRDMRAAAVIVSREAVAGIRAACTGAVESPAIVLVDEPDTCLLLEQGAVGERAELAGGDPLLLLYTSGSTGRPKRVVRGHGQLMGETGSLGDLFALSETDKFLGAAPFSHVNGLVRTVLTALSVAGTVYPVRSFTRHGLLELITREGITYFGGVPRMFASLASGSRHRGFTLASLRVLFSASAPLRRVDAEDFFSVWGKWIRQLYGSTETGTISYNDCADIATRLDSVGRVLPGVEARVIADGRDVPPGMEGEIAVRSRFGAREYHGDSAATERSFRDGFYLTGDVGFTDEEGYLTLTGRKAAMINRGGHKVNPYEVEEAIRHNPKVRDVVVYGGATPDGDETVRCVVVADAPCTPAEIVRHCQGLIADYKIPSVVEFRSRLPETATGKIRRFGLDGSQANP